MRSDDIASKKVFISNEESKMFSALIGQLNNVNGALFSKFRTKLFYLICSLIA